MLEEHTSLWLLSAAEEHKSLILPLVVPVQCTIQKQEVRMNPM
jgi:hypothetical protein